MFKVLRRLLNVANVVAFLALEGNSFQSRAVAKILTKFQSSSWFDQITLRS